MKQSEHTAINWMNRDQIVAELESEGFACYDSESTDDLREALRDHRMMKEEENGPVGV